MREGGREGREREGGGWAGLWAFISRRFVREALKLVLKSR